MSATFVLEFDGGSRGNPGPAAIGVVVRADDGTPLITLGRFIGVATNNVAEYTALLTGLREARTLNIENLIVNGDSELVIRQMQGRYRVKNAGLKPLYEKAVEAAREFKTIVYEHKIRDHNETADKLANLAMDRRKDVVEIS